MYLYSILHSTKGKWRQTATWDNTGSHNYAQGRILEPEARVSSLPELTARSSKKAKQYIS